MLQAILRPKAVIVFKKINNFHFFPYKSLCDEIWPWFTMGQGQPSVIIWTTLVKLPYTMLHTKFHGHWSIGSGEEDFLRFLPYMGMAAMLVMWPRPFEQLFFPKGPWGCIWNLLAISPVVSEEKSFEIVDGRQTDDGACLYYKVPWSLRLRWAKNSKTRRQTVSEWMSELWYNVPTTMRSYGTSVSSERPEKREIDLAIPGLVVWRVIHYTTAAPRKQRV